MSKNYYFFNIKYNDKRFAIYSDEYIKKNFLRILDDYSLCYPDIEDYKVLNNIFNCRKLHKLYMYTILRPVEFEPQVITNKDCDSIGKEKVTDLPQVEDDTENSLTKIEVIETPYGIKFIKRFEGDDKSSYIFCENLQEVKKYLEVKNPSFNDVRMAILNNSNIPEKYKKIAFEYVDELERSNPNQDLAILYYNMSNLREVKSSSKTNDIAKGCFNKFEKKIEVEEDGEREEAIRFKHELTHATYSIEICLGREHIIKDIFHPTITPENEMLIVGMGANEGLTENRVKEMGGETLRRKRFLCI